MSRIALWFRLTLALALSIGIAPAGAAQVTVLDAWVRGTVEGQTATAAYMKLRSDADVRLISVTAPVAARCSVHEMTMDGNLMRMRTLASLPVPARGTVELAPGHDHLMLEQLARPLKEGDTVELTLTFVESSTGKRLQVQVRAPVRPLGAR